MVKLLFFRFQVANWVASLRVTNSKNEKKSWFRIIVTQDVVIEMEYYTN